MPVEERFSGFISRVDPYRGSMSPGWRFIGMCCWLGRIFTTELTIELLGWGRTFSDFGGKTVLHIYGWQTYQNVCTAMKGEVFFIQSKKWASSLK